MSDSLQNSSVAPAASSTSSSVGDDDRARGVDSIPPSIEVDLSTDPVWISTPLGHSIFQRLLPNQSLRVIVRYQLTESIVQEWETNYVNHTMYIEVPFGCLNGGSKDAFLALLGYAEEVLQCSRVVIYFAMERSERESLFRTFMMMGLRPLPHESTLLYAPDPSKLYMAYEFHEQ